MNAPLFQRAKEDWNPKPVASPQVYADIGKLTGLQRAIESFRYVLLRWEHWVSPSGDMREWLRHNTRLGVWLFIPAIFVMPAVSFALWQLTSWLSMLTSIAAKLIVLPLLTLVAFVVIKIVVALFKR